MKNNGIGFFLLVISLCALIHGCSIDYSPKPRGYMRIDLPEPAYLPYESECPFSFEYSQYSLVFKDKNHQEHPCWINLYYPTFNATLHLTYSEVDTNLASLIENTRGLVIKHIPKASDIEEIMVSNKVKSVYGITYDFEGSTASDFQFFLTDSTHHFLRGALYFNMPPNPDSLAPASAYIKNDIGHMLNSFRWENE